MTDPNDRPMDAFRRFDELAATAQHIELLTRKLGTLRQAHADSWAQILTRAADMYRRGELTVDDLIDLIETTADVYGGGYTRLWDTYMPASVRFQVVKGEIMHRKWAAIKEENRRKAVQLNAPNGPQGTWIGTLPVYGPPLPLDGVSVVYVLFDSRNDPIYVGSTYRFRARMNAHEKQKPEARRWAAYPCRNREHAYCMEERLLGEYRLPLNRKAGR